MIRKLAHAWDRFWFGPNEAVPAALLRLSLGAVIVIDFLCVAPSWERFYAADGILSLRDPTVNGVAQGWWSLFYWTEGTFPVAVHWWLGLLAAVAFTAGWFTRTATVVLFLVVASIVHRNPAVVNGEDLVFRMVLWYACFAQLGSVLSLDAWSARRHHASRPEVARIWPLRLMQINIALIYVFSQPYKFVDDTVWLSGDAMYYAVVNRTWSRWPWPQHFYSAAVSSVSTYGSLLMELVFPVLVWIPRLRLYVVLLMGALHVTIAVALSNVTFFSLAMPCCFLAFLTSADLLKLKSMLRLPLRAPAAPAAEVAGTQREDLAMKEQSSAARRSPTAIAAFLAGVLAAGARPGTATAGSFEFLSPVYTVDRIYKSMSGPDSLEEGIYLSQPARPELLWITGYEAVMVGEDGASPMSQEFMCHNTLSLNRELDEHYRLFQANHYRDRRLFTLSQGQSAIEFPKGFGIPVLSNEPLMQQSQVLNLNYKDGTHKVRHRVTVDYLRESELATPMQPLMMLYAYGVALVEGAHSVPPEGFVHGPSCLVSQAAGDVVHTDPEGRQFTQHWVVPPGRQVNRTRVERSMNVPFDTTAHYISVHLHPFGESLELRDLTTGQSMYKSQARAVPGRIGIDHVDYFSSPEGIPLYKDHEYELISVYDNPTSENQDAMALMFLYVLDKGFRKPATADVETPGAGRVLAAQ